MLFTVHGELPVGIFYEYLTDLPICDYMTSRACSTGTANVGASDTGTMKSSGCSESSIPSVD